MTTRNLQFLFEPRSVALIGASDRPHSVGAAVLENLLRGPFHGPISLVNARHPSIRGLTAYPDVAALPSAPDLAVVCTPPATVPAVVETLGARGTRAAIVLTAGLRDLPDDRGGTLQDTMLAAARPHLLRVLGPNCVGLLVPGIGLDASFAHVPALPGRLAFVSQSGAFVTAVLDWARSRNIGFSRFVSLGDAADVDLGDVLDYLASDPATDAVLLYVEAVTAARKFMSAARAAARNKPVVLIKAGRGDAGARAAASHTGAMAGSDAVYEAALGRAGLLRVETTEQLFDAVETLARARPPRGNRLAILTNGGGPGVMAADAIGGTGAALATLDRTTIAALDARLPRNWSHGNPVDIIGDAPGDRYVTAFEALEDDPGVDGVLMIHAPTAIAPSREIAAALLPAMQATDRTVLCCWLGGDGVRDARNACRAAGIPVYDTPEDAVSAYGQLLRFDRAQRLLQQVPPSHAVEGPIDRVGALAVVTAARAQRRTMLTEGESKRVLAAYGIPVAQTTTAPDADAAVRAADAIGYPIALKVLSPQVSHKSDVGGVILDLPDAAAVRAAAATIAQRLQARRPDAVLQGFTVEAMVTRPHAQELIAGIATDPVFGPVILFGHGGTATEVIGDRTIALPPLDDTLARDAIARTRVARLLDRVRDRPAADVGAVADVLVRLSMLAADLPVAELDVNPLLADADGVVALDARVVLRDDDRRGADAFVIRPYPRELEHVVEWRGAQLCVRPVRPRDAVEHAAFFASLDPADLRVRTLRQLRALEAGQLARLTQPDYDREMAFIATLEGDGDASEALGLVRSVVDPDNDTVEFALVLGPPAVGRGLGRLLLGTLIGYWHGRGTRQLVGEASADNDRLIGLARAFAFDVRSADVPGVVTLALPLDAAVAAA